jgi:hypothetical protein
MPIRNDIPENTSKTLSILKFEPTQFHRHSFASSLDVQTNLRSLSEFVTGACTFLRGQPGSGKKKGRIQCRRATWSKRCRIVLNASFSMKFCPIPVKISDARGISGRPRFQIDLKRGKEKSIR